MRLYLPLHVIQFWIQFILAQLPEIGSSLPSTSLDPASLSPIKETVIVALNQEYVAKEQRVEVRPGDEVAVIPPISGG